MSTLFTIRTTPAKVNYFTMVVSFITRADIVLYLSIYLSIYDIDCMYCIQDYAAGLIKTSHPVDERGQRIRIPCEECGKDFATKRNLEDHIQLVHKGKECGDDFRNRKAMGVENILPQNVI